MKAKEFKDKAEKLFEEFQWLIDEMPLDLENLGENGQRAILQQSLNRLERAVNGVEDLDFMISSPSILTYTVEEDSDCSDILIVKAYLKRKTFFEIECLKDSPYTIEEEIQNWLDDNGHEDEYYDFVKFD